MKIVRASIVSAYDSCTVGSKVVDAVKFDAALEAAVAKIDFAAQRTPGQAMVSLPAEVNNYVSAGVGERTLFPSDYVLREHRGVVGAYLRRHMAAPVDSTAAIVYTCGAYVNDPEVRGNPDEIARVMQLEATHVVVAILANAGPTAPRTPERMLAAIAGENHAYDYLSQPGGGVGGGVYRAKVDVAWIGRVAHVRVEAAESVGYWRKWAVVADDPDEIVAAPDETPAEEKAELVAAFDTPAVEQVESKGAGEVL